MVIYKMNLFVMLMIFFCSVVFLMSGNCLLFVTLPFVYIQAEELNMMMIMNRSNNMMSFSFQADAMECIK